MAKEEVQVTEGRKIRKVRVVVPRMPAIIRSSHVILFKPSAYASGALVKCRKVGAANWGNKSEEMDYASFADRAKETLEKNKEKALKGEQKQQQKRRMDCR